MIDYFISTGEKHGFYTLWVEDGSMFLSDNGLYSNLEGLPKFICNLSTTEEGARAAVRKRFEGKVEGKDYSVHWGLIDLKDWGTMLSREERDMVDYIERNRMPWGKNVGALFSDLSVYSLLWHMEADDSYHKTFIRQNISAKFKEALTKYRETSGKAVFDAHFKMIEEKKKAKEARQAEKAKSKHVGVIGERQEFNLCVDHIHYFDTYWGESCITLLSDAEGNQIVYKGQARIGGIKENISLIATVKEQSVREGVKQTIIQRPKVLKGAI